MLAPRGWLISPSSSVADLGRLVSVADEDGVEAAEAALITELNPERLSKHHRGALRASEFRGCGGFPLDQALTAHGQGLYSLSVPIWLIALDGIFLAELGRRSRSSVACHRKDGNSLKKALRLQR